MTKRWKVLIDFNLIYKFIVIPFNTTAIFRDELDKLIVVYIKRKLSMSHQFSILIKTDIALYDKIISVMLVQA